MGRIKNFVKSLYILVVLALSASQVLADDRCKDDSFCRAYCLSTNPDTMSARCGRDLASCICITPYNQAVKVRFIEEKPPVPSTTTTTPRPTTTPAPIPQNFGHAVHYVNSQPVQNGQYGYNGNGNSIGGNNYQQTQQDRLTPVLLECDASEASTKMCHSFCIVEIRAWYGLCNITSKACACFGISQSAVQEEPIAAIFYSTAPLPPTTPRPTPPPQFVQQQQYQIPQQSLQQQQQYQVPQQSLQQQQPWQPIPTSMHQFPQGAYGNYQFPSGPSSPSVLSAAPTNNQLQDQQQGPVRSVASMFGTNGKPLSSSILVPSTPSGVPVNAPVENGDATTTEADGTTTQEVFEENPTSPNPAPFRKRRSLNDTPNSKGKENLTDKGNLSAKGDCTKYKCGIACKRSNYLAPDCKPKCLDGDCVCECSPTAF